MGTGVNGGNGKLALKNAVLALEHVKGLVTTQRKLCFMVKNCYIIRQARK